jgi:hypothetical protein
MSTRRPIDDERIADWVDGRLGERACERFEAELRVNPALRAAAESYRAFVQELRAELGSPADGLGDAGPALTDRILDALGPGAARRPWRPSPLLASLAAAAALVVGFLVIRNLPQAPERLDTAAEKSDRASELGDDRVAGAVTGEAARGGFDGAAGAVDLAKVRVSQPDVPRSKDLALPRFAADEVEQPPLPNEVDPLDRRGRLALGETAGADPGADPAVTTRLQVQQEQVDRTVDADAAAQARKAIADAVRDRPEAGREVSLHAYSAQAVGARPELTGQLVYLVELPPDSLSRALEFRRAEREADETRQRSRSAPGRAAKEGAAKEGAAEQAWPRFVDDFVRTPLVGAMWDNRLPPSIDVTSGLASYALTIDEYRVGLLAATGGLYAPSEQDSTFVLRGDTGQVQTYVESLSTQVAALGGGVQVLRTAEPVLSSSAQPIEDEDRQGARGTVPTAPAPPAAAPAISEPLADRPNAPVTVYIIVRPVTKPVTKPAAEPAAETPRGK